MASSASSKLYAFRAEVLVQKTAISKKIKTLETTCKGLTERAKRLLRDGKTKEFDETLGQLRDRRQELLRHNKILAALVDVMSASDMKATLELLTKSKQLLSSSSSQLNSIDATLASIHDTSSSSSNGDDDACRVSVEELAKEVMSSEEFSAYQLRRQGDQSSR